MRFGVMLNHQYHLGEDIGRRLDEGVEQTELIRDLGYDLLFSHHHFLANMQTPQPLPILAHLIPYSGAMRLGIGIYIATLEHPVALAENFATMDQLSKGRMIFGVGAGYREDEFRAFGVDMSRRLSRLYETIDVCRQLWSGEPVDHHGEHFAIEDQTIGLLPKQRPGLPVWVGANGPKTISRAAAHADAWLGSPNVKFRWANGNLASFKEQQRANGIDVAGREYPIVRELYLADSDARAREELEPYIANEYRAFSRYDEIYDKHYEEMWEKAFLIGSPDSVAAKLETLAEGGWNSFIFRCSWAEMPHEMTVRTIQRFADEVMPRFAPQDAHAT
jgi:alkanesulfonate monooxygenase SsuD/methylene tetrahydromethanopterin reductase-like flavin-dependent oxidoreductase (luciferase family)